MVTLADFCRRYRDAGLCGDLGPVIERSTHAINNIGDHPLGNAMPSPQARDLRASGRATFAFHCQIVPAARAMGEGQVMGRGEPPLTIRTLQICCRV